MSFIVTYTKKHFSFTEPDPSMIDIEDIAHALAHLCRFNGHTKMFYSVAEHCINACEMIEEPDKFTALMHDATEAYIGDMSAPLKSLYGMRKYAQLEQEIWEVIALKFGLPDKLPASVHKVDKQLLADEGAAIWGISEVSKWGLDYVPQPRRFHYYSPFKAKMEFLALFNRLCSK